MDIMLSSFFFLLAPLVFLSLIKHLLSEALYEDHVIQFNYSEDENMTPFSTCVKGKCLVSGYKNGIEKPEDLGALLLSTFSFQLCKARMQLPFSHLALISNTVRDRLIFN